MCKNVIETTVWLKNPCHEKVCLLYQIALNSRVKHGIFVLDRIGDHRWFGRDSAYAQFRQSLRFSHTQGIEAEESSDQTLAWAFKGGFGA